jgi:outer membrane protein OmpA-like peptidoglycan-associated protein
VSSFGRRYRSMLLDVPATTPGTTPNQGNLTLWQRYWKMLTGITPRPLASARQRFLAVGLGVLAVAGLTAALVLAPITAAPPLAKLEPESGPVTSRLQFDLGSARLSPDNDNGRVLELLVKALRQSGTTVVINGYASAVGSTSGAYSLSLARVLAVASFLRANGVRPSSITVIVHGPSDSAGAARAVNRTVVIVIEKPR